jgi:hypothetical protein
MRFEPRVGVRMSGLNLVDTNIVNSLRKKTKQCFKGSNLGQYDVR